MKYQMTIAFTFFVSALTIGNACATSATPRPSVTPSVAGYNAGADAQAAANQEELSTQFSIKAKRRVVGRKHIFYEGDEDGKMRLETVAEMRQRMKRPTEERRIAEQESDERIAKEAEARKEYLEYQADAKAPAKFDESSASDINDALKVQEAQLQTGQAEQKTELEQEQLQEIPLVSLIAKKMTPVHPKTQSNGLSRDIIFH